MSFRGQAVLAQSCGRWVLIPPCALKASQRNAGASIPCRAQAWHLPGISISCWCFSSSAGIECCDLLPPFQNLVFFFCFLYPSITKWHFLNSPYFLLCYLCQHWFYTSEYDRPHTHPLWPFRLVVPLLSWLASISSGIRLHSYSLTGWHTLSGLSLLWPEEKSRM